MANGVSAATALSAEVEGEQLAWTAMLWLGASALAPWLAYIAAADFFIDVYPHARLMYVFPVQNMMVLTAGTVILMLVGERVTLHSRIVTPQLWLIGFMLVVPALNIAMADHFFALVATLVAQFLGACCVTVTQTASYGAAGSMGPQFTNALETGKGIGGLGIVLARMVSKALLPDNAAGLRTSTNIFFLFANSMIVAAVVLWFGLQKTPFAQLKFGEYEKQRLAKLCAPPPNGPAVGPAGQRQVEMVEQGRKQGEKAGLLQPDPDCETVSFLEVFKKIWLVALLVCTTFVVTIGCFPGLTTSLKSHTLNLGDWFPVLLVFCFNSGDLVGKYMPNFFQRETCMLFDTKTICIPALLHCLFVPMFVYVISEPGGMLGSDQFAFFLVFSLGIFTGYITCTCMMFGPGCVQEKDRVVAGQMMSLFLMIGLFTGSVLGILLAFYTGER